MIICLCDGVSDRQIQRAIDDGATTIPEFMSRRIGTGCGSCHGMILQMLRASQAASAAPVASASTSEILSATA